MSQSSALLLIAAIICVINQCGGRCLRKCCRITTVRTSVIHGMSTFLVLYSQCIKISLNLLTPVYLHMEEHSTHKPPTRVWFNGDSELFFSKKHLLYALPALFCLFTLGLLPPALLLTYPLLNKVLAVLSCEDLKVVKLISQNISISNLKPLLDSFRGCFKDNFRFFAGLYFLYWWTLLLIYMNTKSYSNYYTAVGVMLVFMLTLHTLRQPYIKQKHILDALLFANWVPINSFSFLIFYSSDHRKGTTITPAILQQVLIFLPLLVMGMCLLVTFYRTVVKQRCVGTLAGATVIFIPKSASQLRELIKCTEWRLCWLMWGGSLSYEHFSEEDTDYIVEYKYFEDWHIKDVRTYTCLWWFRRHFIVT